MIDSLVPRERVKVLNNAPVAAEKDHVLYWMIAFRRVGHNFALQRAVEWAARLRKPLLVFEPLRVGYPWACARHHRFVLDGMADNAARLADQSTAGVLYYPYAEPRAGAGQGLFAALAQQACVVVTDDYPCFFLPRMVAAAAARAAARMEAVDSNGLLPLRVADRAFPTAHAFRRFLQRELPVHLARAPRADPLQGVSLPPAPTLPADIVRRWPPAAPRLLAGDAGALAALPIDHAIGAAPTRGGAAAASARLRAFLREHLATYAASANQPDDDARSGLSPYLHFGHVSSHQLFEELATRAGWTPDRLSAAPSGARSGWWGLDENAESWLDEFITWRELGYNFCAHRHDYAEYESLPSWALATLAKHAGDARSHVYSLDQFAAAATHDPLWNAAQRQLVREGRLHNYLRMLWGKKILEWTAQPRDALAVMIELNNRYALDGRDPNSYSGIFWVLGRFDRAWGPERPVFGTVRYMSSDSTRKKLRIKEYLRRHAENAVG